jgi:hypothetical protein
MVRDTSISLADDSRGRVPFAIIAVVLLTTSVMTVSTLNNRSTPERDVSPDEVHRRLTMSTDSIISDAVDDAIAEAGQAPVTKPADSPVGKALAADDGVTGYNEEDTLVNPYDGDDVFGSYVKLLIYKKVNQRLKQARQTKTGGEVTAVGEATLPQLEPDRDEITNALDRIEITVGPTEELEKGEYRVSIKNVKHNVYTKSSGPVGIISDKQQIYTGRDSYTVTGETAIFEMHSQVRDYEFLLDNKMEGEIRKRQWPTLLLKVTWERVMGDPVTSGNAFDEMIWRTEQELFLNDGNYEFQKAAFGTRDQSYPEVPDAAQRCHDVQITHAIATGLIERGVELLANAAMFVPGAGKAVGAVGKVAAKFVGKVAKGALRGSGKMARGLNIRGTDKWENKKAKEVGDWVKNEQKDYDEKPGETTKEFVKGVGDTVNTAQQLAISTGALCSQMMYSTFPQSTSTADADLPPTIEYGAGQDTDYTPPEEYQTTVDEMMGQVEYSEERAKKRVSGPHGIYEQDYPSEDGTIADVHPGAKDVVTENGFAVNREINVSRFANGAYSEMFDKSPSVFAPISEQRMSEIRNGGQGTAKIKEAVEKSGGSIGSGTETTLVTNEREEVVNDLRITLINDIDSYETKRMHVLTSENLYGKLISQIENKANGYIYADHSSSLRDRDVYELRNKYIRNVVKLIEQSEQRRQDIKSGMNTHIQQNTGGESNIHKEVVSGQLAMESAVGVGEAGTDRAEELSDMAVHSSGGGELDRWTSEDTQRDVYRYHPHTGLYGRDRWLDVDEMGRPKTDVTDDMLFRFGMETAPQNLDTIKQTKIRGALKDTGATMYPVEIWKDYPPKTFPDDFEWPDDFPEDPTLDDDELPAPSKFNERELPDDVESRSEYEFPEDAQTPEDWPDNAGKWYIRPVVPEKNVYKITNTYLTERSLGGDVSNHRQYVQINKHGVNDNDGAANYTLTIIDVPQTSGDPANPIGDPASLVPPKLQEPPEKAFRFEVHASPGYLSSMPLSRQAEPGIRAPHGGITHARNLPYSPASQEITNGVPNFGIPISPVPWPIAHYVSANMWSQTIKAEYARFELRAKPQRDDDSAKDGTEYTFTDDLNGPERYVRLEQNVTIRVGDTGGEAAVGGVEPIDTEATTHYPFAMPGFMAWPLGNWGLGNYASAPWTPQTCTGTWPNVGPGAAGGTGKHGNRFIREGCAGLGPVGQIALGGILGGGFGKRTGGEWKKTEQDRVGGPLWMEGRKQYPGDNPDKTNADIPTSNKLDKAYEEINPNKGSGWDRFSKFSKQRAKMWAARRASWYNGQPISWTDFKRKTIRHARESGRTDEAEFLADNRNNDLIFTLYWQFDQTSARYRESMNKFWNDPNKPLATKLRSHLYEGVRSMPAEGAAWESVNLWLILNGRNSGSFPPSMRNTAEKLCQKKSDAPSEEWCPDVKHRDRTV